MSGFSKVEMSGCRPHWPMADTVGLTTAASRSCRRPGQVERRTHGYQRHGTTSPCALHAARRFLAHLVERSFALPTEKQLRRGVHHSTREPEVAIKRYLAVHNEAPKPFVWTKTADEILNPSCAVGSELRA